MRPKEAVACMNCPLAVWMLKGASLECYCRTLYMTVWETHTPGKIRMCDAQEQEQARIAAEANEAPEFVSLSASETPVLSSSQPAPAFNEETQSFGLLATGKKAKKTTPTEYL